MKIKVFLLLFLVIPGMMTAGTKQPTYTSFIEGFVRYDNFWQSPMGNDNVQLIQNNLVVAQVNTDAVGYFIFQNVPPGTYSIHVITNKLIGGINASDGLLVLQAFVNQMPLTPLQKKVADVNGSGGFPNAVDALAILMYFSGSITEFMIDDWFFEQVTASVNGYNSASVYIKCLCAGDVNRSYIP